MGRKKKEPEYGLHGIWNVRGKNPAGRKIGAMVYGVGPGNGEIQAELILAVMGNELPTFRWDTATWVRNAYSKERGFRFEPVLE